jgi:hypothetical protein
MHKNRGHITLGSAVPQRSERWAKLLSALLLLCLASQALEPIAAQDTAHASSSLFVWHQEAEAGTLTAPMAIGRDTAASACYYISSPTNGSGAATFTFTAPLYDTYYLWARAMGPSWGENSFFVSMDGGPELHYEIGSWRSIYDDPLAWGWELVHANQQGLLSFVLSAGPHTLHVRAREPNARLDAIVISNNYMTYTPQEVAPCDSTPTATATGTATPTLYPRPEPMLAWTAESNQSESQFGYAVSSAGDVNSDGYADVVISAPYYNDGQYQAGKVFVYYGSPAGLRAAADWSASGHQWKAFFGLSISAAGDVNGDGYDDVLIGAPGLGKTFAYYGSAAGLGATPNWTTISGAVVGTAGDVNHDGYADVIIGAPGAAKAFVYHGSPTGLGVTPNWTAQHEQTGSQFGAAVSKAGDVNGDSYADIIVGAPGYMHPWWDQGGAFIYYGSATGPSLTPDAAAEGSAESKLGATVGAAGDVNGDGYADVVVGAPGWGGNVCPGCDHQGGIYLYYGSASGLIITPSWGFTAIQRMANIGVSVNGTGDVNGDSYDEFLVGADLFDNGQTDEGQAYLYYGSATGAQGFWTGENNQSFSHFGFSVAGAGDVNGDGYDDFLIGAPHFAGPMPNEGRAYLYYGAGAPRPTATATPTTAPTATDTPSFTTTFTPSPTATPSPTGAPTYTLTPTATDTATATAVWTPTSTPIVTETPTPTATLTSAPETATPSATPRPTLYIWLPMILRP